MILEKLKALTFVIFLVVVNLLNMGFHSNEAISDTENRVLQTAPKVSIQGVLNDKVTSKIDAYISDHFMLRNEMIQISNKIEKLRGLSSEIVMLSVGGDNMSSDMTLADAALKVETEPLKNVEINCFIYENRAFRSFKRNDSAETKYAEAISHYAMANENFTVYSLVAPTQAAFVPDKYKEYTDDPAASIHRISKLMSGQVKFINPMHFFYENSDKYLFFRTDHHWNGSGAYYAYVSFCKVKGIEPVPLGELKLITADNYVGSLYKMTNSEVLKNHPDQIEAYLPLYPVSMERYKTANGKVVKYGPYKYSVSKKLMGKTTSYSIFIGGDIERTIIKTKSDQVENKILVIKDSYGNAFSPYLSNHYAEVHIIDPRYWKGSIKKYMTDNSINDVLFINNADITIWDGFDQTLRSIF